MTEHSRKVRYLKSTKVRQLETQSRIWDSTEGTIEVGHSEFYFPSVCGFL